jgi:hypothetical protein
MTHKVDIEKMQPIEKWLECPRDDLNIIPHMIKNGFDVHMDDRDKRNERTTPDNVPHNCVSFAKGNLHIWKFYENMTNGYNQKWQTAFIIDGYFRNHQSFDTIEEAMQREQ